MSAELIGILSVGVAVAALILTRMHAIREEMREHREEMREYRDGKDYSWRRREFNSDDVPNHECRGLLRGYGK